MPATALRGTPARGAARTVRSDGASARPGCGPRSRWTRGQRCGKPIDHGRGTRVEQLIRQQDAGVARQGSGHSGHLLRAPRRAVGVGVHPPGTLRKVLKVLIVAPMRAVVGAAGTAGFEAVAYRLARERPLPCGTQPTPARAIAADGRPAITSPSSATAAELAGVFPIRALNGAVFPARLRPGILRISPCRTSKLTSCGVWHSREGR